MSHCKIDRRVNRSAKVVSNFLHDPAAYGTKYKPGRALALDDRGRRRLFNEARKTGSSARKLQSLLQLTASVRSTQRKLRQNDLYKYVKRNHAPALTPTHRSKRLDRAKMMLKRELSGAKSSSPTKRSSAWTARTISRAAGITFATKTIVLQSPQWRWLGDGMGLLFVAWTGRLGVHLGAAKLRDVLQHVGRPSAPVCASASHQNIQFQQDGASCHRVRDTIAFFQEQGVTVVEHPALSPDLDSIENLWGLLARAVYRNGRQFMSEDDLKSVILSEWVKIEVSYLQKLIESMPDRCFQVIERKGVKTSY